MGIFICGGVFNLRPWIKERSEQRDGNLQEPVSLHPMPSSTSVFRTASGSEVMGRRPWQSSWRISYLISNYDYLFMHQTVMFLLLGLSWWPPSFLAWLCQESSASYFRLVTLSYSSLSPVPMRAHSGLVDGSRPRLQFRFACLRTSPGINIRPPRKAGRCITLKSCIEIWFSFLEECFDAFLWVPITRSVLLFVLRILRRMLNKTSWRKHTSH